MQSYTLQATFTRKRLYPIRDQYSLSSIGTGKESRNSCESTVKGKEKNSSENLKTVEVEEDPLPPSPPEVSYSVKGDLGNYKPIPMDVKLAEVIDDD